jgi:hypothetical protein
MRPWIRQAVAAAVLVGLSIAGTLFYVGRDRVVDRTANGSRISTLAETGSKSLEDALRSIRNAEEEYIRAIQALNAIVERQKSSLDPQVLHELQVNLKVIDENIAATRLAYYAHPTDADLALFMLAAYSRKVELLQNLTS